MTDDEIRALRTVHVEAMNTLARGEDILEQAELLNAAAPSWFNRIVLYLAKAGHELSFRFEQKVRAMARKTYEH